MNQTPPKPPATPDRLFPGVVMSGLLIVLLLIVLYMRVMHEVSETGWLDEAAANMATYAATIIATISLWTWFCFRSTYSAGLRRGVMFAGLAGAALFLGTVRMEGITGNWVPTGSRV